MPSQPRTNLYKSCILSCLVTVALYSAAVGGAFAASAATADQSTYAGNMLDKIIEIWAPPPALKSDFRVRIKVSINSHGQVEACKPLKSSGLEAFDSSVCGAVRQIGSFGTPPYAAPTDIHLTFWNGTPKGKTKPETLSSEEALRQKLKPEARPRRPWAIRGPKRQKTVPVSVLRPQQRLPAKIRQRCAPPP